MNMTKDDDSARIQEERSKILRIKSRRMLFIAGMAVAIILVMGYSFTIGSSSLTASEAYKILLDQIFPGMFGEFSDNHVFIVTELRAPRVLVAALVGGMLAVGGCIVQSLLKNPLATPYTLGVSAGACVGASLYFIFNITIIPGAFGLVTNTFLFSMIPVAIMLFAVSRRYVSSTTLILSGVAFSYIFSSLNSIMQYFGDESAVTNVVFWTIGDLSMADLAMVPVLVIALAGYLAFSQYFGKDLDIMRMGDDTAASLGVNVKGVRASALIVCCLMTAISVSCAGPIGFVCLIAPHVCRKMVGSEIRWLAPMSAGLGAMLLLVADMIAKTIAAPMMLPVGSVTALVGAPIMVYILYSKKGMSS